MIFVDRAKIFVKGGDGGNGCVSFRREKYVPRGGPDGGDGGKGGDVIIEASSDISTLLDQKYRQHYVAGRGGHGRGKNQHGRDGEDVIIRVPVGTVVYDDETGEILADLVHEGQRVVVARGGRGGKGNAAFVTPVNRAPRYAQPGEPGEARYIRLELKVLADVGIIGLPNAGKSTFIAAVSRVRPKIADYPFTTLTPNLGVVHYDRYKSFVIADIPGLIEGAHEGRGLGFQFLKHVERTFLLLHLIDVSDMASMPPVEALKTVNREIYLYSPELMKKPMIIVATKIDAMTDRKRLQALSSYCKDHNLKFFAISAITGKGVKDLITYVGKEIDRLRHGKDREGKDI